MALLLRDVLALEAVTAADPHVLVEGDADAPVRWAHSSEIYEIGPLLDAGALLLTTGLGLAGADAGARRHWVREVASRGVAAVAVEPGRSLTHVPEEMVDEARHQGLALVELRAVVPFMRICREVNTLVLDAESRLLRRADALVLDLQAAAQEGQGLSGLLAVTAEACGTAAVLGTRSGRVVAAAGTTDDRAATRLLTDGPVRAPVHVAGRHWGDLALGPVAAPTRRGGRGAAENPDELAHLSLRAASVLGIVVAHGAEGDASEVAASLLSDLLDGAVDGEQTVTVRAGIAGFHPGQGDAVLGIAARAPDLRTTAVALRRALAPSPVLATPVGGQVLALAAVPSVADADGATAKRLAAQGLEARGIGKEATVVVGPAGPLERAAHSLREASAGLAVTAPAITAKGPLVTTARASVLTRMIAELPRERLSRLVDDALGPVLAWDVAHGTALVATVAVHLRHGSNVTRTAQVLHLRRQSVHSRLARAEQLLGRRLGDPDDIDLLLAATRAHEVLAAPGVHGVRGGNAPAH